MNFFGRKNNDYATKRTSVFGSFLYPPDDNAYISPLAVKFPFAKSSGAASSMSQVMERRAKEKKKKYRAKSPAERKERCSNRKEAESVSESSSESDSESDESEEYEPPVNRKVCLKKNEVRIKKEKKRKASSDEETNLETALQSLRQRKKKRDADIFS